MGAIPKLYHKVSYLLVLSFSMASNVVLALRFGVTTFMDMHNEIPNVTTLRKQSKENPTDAADFKTCGIAATIENGWPIPVVTAHDKSEEVIAP